MCSCGCSLISTLPNVKRSYEGSGIADIAAGTKAASAAVAIGNAFERYDEQFLLRDKATGQPVSSFAYGMETDFGEHHDEIYEDGATVKAFSETPTPVILLYAMQMKIGLRQ